MISKVQAHNSVIVPNQKIIKHGCCWRLTKAIQGIFLILAGCSSEKCHLKGKKFLKQAINGEEIIQLTGKKLSVKKSKPTTPLSKAPTPVSKESTAETISSQTPPPKGYVPYTYKGFIELLEFDKPLHKGEYSFWLVKYSDEKIAKLNEMIESFDELYQSYLQGTVDQVSNKYFTISAFSGSFSKFVNKVELKAYTTSQIFSCLYEDANYEFEIRPYGLLALLRGHIYRNYSDIMGIAEHETFASLGKPDHNAGIFIIEKKLSCIVTEEDIKGFSPQGTAQFAYYSAETQGGKRVKQQHMFTVDSQFDSIF